MIFSYNWLNEFISGDLPDPKELERLIAMHVFEVEEVKRHGKDWLFDVDILPNRMPDAASHEGFARELSAITKDKFVPSGRKKVSVKKGSLDSITVDIKDTSMVPRYSFIVVEGVKIGSSPVWLKKRLESLGVNSINNMVDLTNYIMLETGQPMHVFDADRINGSRMRVRLSRKGEKLTLLDDDEVELEDGMLVIEDDRGLIDLAGIMGGLSSSVSDDTKNVILQAATFDARTIYRARKALNINTQASALYASGLDPNITWSGLERAVKLLDELGGGKVVQSLDIYSEKVSPLKIGLSVDRMNGLLGTSISRTEAASILKRLGFSVEKRTEDLLVEVPTRRRDIAIQEDLIEEIGRLYGYEHISAVFPSASLLPHDPNPMVVWRERARDAMREAGMNETYSYSFLGEKDLDTFEYTDKERGMLVELENPLSEDVKYPRYGMVEGLIKQLADNQRKYSDISLFEVGAVYGRGNKGGILEQDKLSAVVQNGSFYDIKGVGEFLLKRFSISNVRYVPATKVPALWDPNRTAEVRCGKKVLGYVGEVSRSVLKRMKIKGTVSAMSFNMESLVDTATEEYQFMPAPRFPPVMRDVALLVPRSVKVADVLNIIHLRGKSLVRDVDLFDMYEGDNLPGGKKSLAFRIKYQSDERTLSGEEVDGLHKDIIRELENNSDWEVRK